MISRNSISCSASRSRALLIRSNSFSSIGEGGGSDSSAGSSLEQCDVHDQWVEADAADGKPGEEQRMVGKEIVVPHRWGAIIVPRVVERSERWILKRCC